MLNGPNGSTCLIKQIKNFRYFLVLLLVAAVSVAILPSAKADTTGAAVPITFTSPDVELITGPQLSVAPITPFPWFDQTQVNRGTFHAAGFPKLPPIQLTGTVSVNSNSVPVTGSGTRFLSEIDPLGPAPFFNGRMQIRDGTTTTYRQV